ncbi:MAG: hypothetical protein HKN13_02790 [Rhodothermales bacterium]|nr:hypothetical protein [Rhodothermales bacterium]
MTESENGIGMRISSDPDVTSVKAGGEAGRKQNTQPLRLLFVSDLTPQAIVEDWKGVSRIRSVDKNSFDQLIADLAPRLVIDVPNHISATPPQFELALQFASLEDFHPSHLAVQVPAVATLVNVRSLVAKVASGGVDAETFRTELAKTGVDAAWGDKLYDTLSAPVQSKPAPPATRQPEPPAEGSLGRLMDMVDDGTGSPPNHDGDESTGSQSSFMNRLSEAVSGDSDSTKLERSAADRLTADLDNVIAAQVNAILAHEEVRELESAWRGLKFLIDRIDFRSNIQLDVLAVSRPALSEALYYQVLLPEHARTSGASLSTIVLDFAFDNSQSSVAQLADIAETAASLQLPVIASASPAFFGVANLRGVARLPLLWQHFDGPEYLHWRKFRELEEAKNLTLAAPSFLLRFPYGDTNPVDDFSIVEDGHLWGRAALLVAVAMANSYKRTGWSTHLRLAEIEDLPIWSGEAGTIALEAALTEGKLRELGDTGFTAFGCRANEDKAFVAAFATASKPGTFETDEETAESRVHSTLPCQLFVSRAAHFLLAMQAEIQESKSIEDAQREVLSRCNAFMGVSDDPSVVEVSHIEGAGGDGQEAIAIRLSPPATVVPQPFSLALGVRVGVSEKSAT